MDRHRPPVRRTLRLALLGVALFHPQGSLAQSLDGGQLVPGETRYAGTIHVQGQTHPVALTTTIRDGGDVWIVEEAWTFPRSSMRETGALDKDTLFLLRHTSRIPAGTLRELVVRGGRISGWEKMPGLPGPRKEYSIETTEPLFPWGAGGPQVIATLPLAEGYSTTVWVIKLPDAVVSRKLEVVGTETLQVPAGTFDAWKVVLGASEPGGHDETVWVDIGSHRVVRYDGATLGPGPSWTVTLER